MDRWKAALSLRTEGVDADRRDQKLIQSMPRSVSFEKERKPRCILEKTFDEIYLRLWVREMVERKYGTRMKREKRTMRAKN